MRCLLDTNSIIADCTGTAAFLDRMREHQMREVVVSAIVAHEVLWRLQARVDRRKSGRDRDRAGWKWSVSLFDRVIYTL